MSFRSFWLSLFVTGYQPRATGQRPPKRNPGRAFNDNGPAPQRRPPVPPSGIFAPKPGDTVRLNTDKTVGVATNYRWNPDMSQAPRGVKLQLLGKGGVAVYGTYDGKNPFWVKWAPVPSN